MLQYTPVTDAEIYESRRTDVLKRRRERQRVFADMRAWNAAQDAIVISDASYLANCRHRQWVATRAVELPKALAELEALHAAWLKVIYRTPDATDNDCERAEEAYDTVHATWFQRYQEHFDRLSWSFHDLKERRGAIHTLRKLAAQGWKTKEQIRVDSLKESAVTAPLPTGTPLPAGTSMIGGDPATVWASINRFGNPEPGDWANVGVLLRRLKIKVRYNAWTERTEINDGGDAWADLQDWHLDKIARVGSSDPHNFRPSDLVLRRSVNSLARDNTVDPAIDLLDRLQAEYDGVPRLRTWLSKACGVIADDYHAAAGVAILCGLVARIRVPGIKFDLMPVFISELQGMSKSTLASILALDKHWFLEDIALGESSKELVLLLAGKSVVEISEMRSRGEVNAVKAMISRTHDEGRPAYGRTPVKRPRRHIFVGTTNEAEFLEDISGGRRFLPVNVRGEIDLQWLRLHIGQLVGEAATLQANGGEIGLPRTVWAIAGEHQEAARVTSAAEELLRQWYGGDEDDVCVPTAEIVRRLVDERQQTTHRAVAGIMRRLGYVPVRNNTARMWVRSSTGKHYALCRPIWTRALPPPPPPPA